MKRTACAVSICILLILVFALQRAIPMLPMDNSGLVEEKYDSFSGVIDVWAYQGWTSAGSLKAWLNDCCAQFEKSRNGVYVQITWVDARAIAEFSTTGIAPPDVLLFPPGLITDATGLLPYNEEIPWRGGMTPDEYAVPVALGLYAWAVSPNAPQKAPALWTQQDGARIVIPADEAWRAFSGAAIALLSGYYSAEDEFSTQPLPGMDVGLESINPPEPTPMPARGDTEANPSGVLFPSENAMDEFLSGDAAALLITQSELAHLDALEEAGRGTDMRVMHSGEFIFTDQVLFAAAVDTQRPNAAARGETARAFISHLLSQKSQQRLHLAGVFSPMQDVQLYTAGSMAVMEAALDGANIILPSPFEAAWRAESEALLGEILSGETGVNHAAGLLISQVK